MTPPPSPSANNESTYAVAKTPTFDPSRPAIGPEEAVLLPCDKVSMYLDSALTILGLHLEARTSFITFVRLDTPLSWIP